MTDVLTFFDEAFAEGQNTAQQSRETQLCSVQHMKCPQLCQVICTDKISLE